MINEGLVASLARPGGNVTGFTNFEPSMGSKWLGLIKEIAPGVRRIGFLHNPNTLANINDMHAAETAAPSIKVEVFSLGVGDVNEIERVIAAFAVGPENGLIVAPNPVTITNHDLIVKLAARVRLPAIYPFDFYASEGGLVSYGPDQIHMFKRAASYVDRIFKGARVAELPIQMPTKFELAINVKTAKTLGLTVPQTLLVAADKVIE
jgi:putative ABC transport system substrate-binding protein